MTLHLAPVLSPKFWLVPELGVTSYGVKRLPCYVEAFIRL